MPDYWRLWLERIELVGKIPRGSLRGADRHADIMVLRHAAIYVAVRRAKFTLQMAGMILKRCVRTAGYAARKFSHALRKKRRQSALRAYRIAVRAWVWARAELRQKVWA